MQHGCVVMEAESNTTLASVQLMLVAAPAPVDAVLDSGDTYRLDLSLSPRPHNARLRYAARWADTRFEPAGKLFVIPPRQRLQAQSERGEHRILVCRLGAALHEELVQPPHDWSDRILAAGLDITDAELRALLERMAHELRHPGFASELMLELLATQLAIQLTRFYGSIKRDEHRAGLSPWRMRVIEERVRELKKPPTLAELASSCRMSVRQLGRAFRQSRGCAISDYIASVRVEHAERLLLAGHSVKAVAYTLGFSSASAFCFAFRRSTGKSPLQFRQTLKAHVERGD